MESFNGYLSEQNKSSTTKEMAAEATELVNQLQSAYKLIDLIYSKAQERKTDPQSQLWLTIERCEQFVFKAKVEAIRLKKQLQ